MSPATHDTARGGNADAREREFDRAAQRLHAEALDTLTPQTLSRLRAARRTTASAAPERRGLGWILAGGSAAVLALAVAVQLQRGPMDAAPSLQTAATAPADGLDSALPGDDYPALVAGLDENPDLYLWLAANHDALPASLER